MQFLAAYIMKGRMQAIAVASTLALLSLIVPPLSVVSSAVIALITLRLGGLQGAYTLLNAMVVVGIISELLLGGYQFALVYGIFVWLPIWLIANVLRESRQLVLAVEVAALLGIVIVVGFYLLQTDPAQIWRELLNVMIKPVLQSQPDIPVEALQQSVEAMAHFMTGVMVMFAVFGLVLGLFLARFWQANLYNPGGFRTEYLALQGHSFLALATVVLLGVAFASEQELCWNILVVLIAFYAFTGAALLHCALVTMEGSKYWLIAFYLMIFIVPQLMALLLSVCGLIDTWLNLRNKLKPNGA